MEDLILIQPTPDHAAQIRAYRQAFLDAGDSMDGTGTLSRRENPMDWLRDTENCTRAETLPDGWVTATQFIALRPSDAKIVGMIQIRHRLNEHLAQIGGHIGYSVHPAERRKGYAKAMLQACLPHCRALGLDNVLVTCDEENEASRRTILANGGIYITTVFDPEEQLSVRHYRITL